MNLNADSLMEYVKVQSGPQKLELNMVFTLQLPELYSSVANCTTALIGIYTATKDLSCVSYLTTAAS